MPGSISESESVSTVTEQSTIVVTGTDIVSCPLKHNKDNRGSISSVDSSISLSYDAAPFTPRGSLTDSHIIVLTDNNASSVITDHATNTTDAVINSRRESDSTGTESSLDEGNSSGAEYNTQIKRVFINDAVVRAAEESAKSCGISNTNKRIDNITSNNNNNNNSSEEDGYEQPDEELIKKIVDQVEYYFSDENIVKDAFLLKHVRRNKEGYVSLKLIASFKRVKHIAKDWRAVRDALRTASVKLEINESGTKLRRLDPLPSYDQTTPSRTIVAINVPPEKATIERIAEMFRTCGEIALIRVLRPGNPIPADVRPFYNKHPEMHGVVSGLIEFVRTESAHNALNRTDDTEQLSSTDNKIQILELNAPASSAFASRRRSVNNRHTNYNNFSNNHNNNNNNNIAGGGTGGKYYRHNNNHHHYNHHRNNNRLVSTDSDFSSPCQSSSETEDVRFRHHQYVIPHDVRLQRRYSSSGDSEIVDHQPPTSVLMWNATRRWSRDSGSDSPGSNFSRSRSNSGVYYPPSVVEQQQSPIVVRRMSAGWESGSDSYSCSRSRSNSGVSIPDVFAMRRYSLPRKDSTTSECCCCNSSKCCDTPNQISTSNNQANANDRVACPLMASNNNNNNSIGGNIINNNHNVSEANRNNNNNNSQRRYSFGKSNDFSAPFTAVRRCSNDYTIVHEQPCRNNSSNPEYYCPPSHRNNNNNNNGGNSFERRLSFGKNNDCPSRRNSIGQHTPSDSVRRLSDSDGRLLAGSGGISLNRQRSFGGGGLPIGHGPENVIRLPRGPDGGRGFQRDLSEYAVPE